MAEDRCADRIYICNRAASELRVMFRAIKTDLRLAPLFFLYDRCKAVPVL